MELKRPILQTSAKNWPPATLSDRGQEFWRETIDLIPGLVLPLEAAIVERFCDWREMSERLEREHAHALED